MRPSSRNYHNIFIKDHICFFVGNYKYLLKGVLRKLHRLFCVNIMLFIFDKKLANPALLAKKSHHFSREWLFIQTNVNVLIRGSWGQAWRLPTARFTCHSIFYTFSRCRRDRDRFAHLGSGSYINNFRTSLCRGNSGQRQ